MVDCGRVLGKGKIPASTEKLSGRVPEKGRISVNTRKWENAGEYREKVESEPGPRNCPDEYLIGVESVSVPENGTMRASTGKR